MKYFRHFLIFIPWIILSIFNIGIFKLPNRDMTSLVFWYYNLLFLSLLFYPVIGKAFPKSLDRAYGISKPLAVLFYFFINWILTTIGILNFDSPGLFMCILILMFFCHKAIGVPVNQKKEDLNELLDKNYNYVVLAETVFFITFVLFLVVNSYHPEIYWGEKPMDFTFLNYLVRLESLPVQDPWFFGETMHYYYFGYYIFAGFIKNTGISPEVGYALSLATSAAFMATASFTLILNVTKRTMLAFGGALTIVLSSNWKSFSGIVFDGSPQTIQTFWKTTRVFSLNNFAEFPSWGFLFGDLHPHIMAYPFGVILLVFIHNFLAPFRKEKGPLYFFLFALTYGSLLAINTWDFVIYTVLFACILILQLFRTKNIFAWFKAYIWPILIVGCLSIILYLPMFLILRTGKATKLELFSGEFNRLHQYFSHQGNWWFMLALMIGPVIYLRIKKKNLKGIHTQSFFVSLFASTIVLNIFAELVVFMDRTNTIFKTLNIVWILLGFLSIFSLRYFRVFIKHKNLMFFSFFTMIIWCSGFVGTIFNITSLNSYTPFGAKRPTLYGSSYLKKMNPDDYEVIKWLRGHVVGTPLILEKYSKSFDHRAARISMHTGLPTYLGWDGHVLLRGASPKEILKRKAEIDYIYKNIDVLKVHEVLKNINAKFLIIGRLELQSYGVKGLVKFKQYKDLFTPLVESGDTVLYGIGDYKKYILKTISRVKK